MATEIKDFNSANISIDEKSYENILVYNISCKSLIDAKPLRIRFVKVEGFIKVYDGTRYLVLFAPEEYDAICNRIRYLISLSDLHILFLIIMQESNLIRMTHYL